MDRRRENLHDNGGARERDPWARTIVVEREMAGTTLDRFLANAFPELDRMYLRRLMREGRVRVDGVPMTSSRPLWRNAIVNIDSIEDEDIAYDTRGEDAALSILYDDAAIAIIDKPAGLLVTPKVLARDCPELEAPRGDALRVAEKVDRDASGIVVITKTLAAARSVESSYASGEVAIEAHAVVEGRPEEDAFELNVPIGPDARHTGRMEGGGEEALPAATHFIVRSRFDGYASLAAMPRTHRTHQIRVHLQAAGFPLLGDPVYGRNVELLVSDLKRGYTRKPGVVEKPIFSRMALHFEKIQLMSPAGARAEARSPAPADMRRLMQSLERYRTAGGRERNW